MNGSNISKHLFLTVPIEGKILKAIGKVNNEA
jgi:hypothetical protein